MAQPQDWDQMFRRSDKDNNGFVTTAELAQAMKMFGYPGTETTIMKLINAADKNGDKKLSLKEFQSSMAKAPTELHLAALLNSMFTKFDMNKDVAITKDELQKTFKKKGHEVTDDQITKIMTAADKDKSGTINVQEFIDAVGKKLL